jgi:hypothetical protein
MKHILLIFFLLPIVALSQKDTIVAYSGVIRIENVSKDELYQRARAWMADAFKNSKEVLQVQDKETGELIGNGIVESYIPYNNIAGKGDVGAWSSFKISIWVKDGRYKYEITDINNTSLSSPTLEGFGLLTSSQESKVKWSMIRQSKMNEFLLKYRIGIDKKMESIISSLKNAMEIKPKSDF